MRDGPALVDVHQLGQGQTGNETWARNIVQVLEADGEAPLHYAVTQGQQLQAAPERCHVVSGRSATRLALEVPALLRRLGSSAVLTQYTLPVTTTPGVVVIHDLSFEHPEARTWIPARSLLRYRVTIGASARRASVVLAPTEYTRQELLARYRLKPDRVLVAPLALDHELTWTTAPRPRARSYSSVLCVGTVLPRKNLPVVADAVAALRSHGDDVRLRLVGPLRDPGKPDVERMRAVLGSALEVVGEVGVEQLRQEYAEADVLAFPSRFEGFGFPLLEAMAAGTPVVCSDATCLPEVAGGAALLVDPLDPAAWAETLARVLADASLRESLRAAGLARAADFTWEQTGAVVRRALSLASGRDQETRHR